MDRAAGGGGCSLTSCAQDAVGSGRRLVLHRCGCSSAGRARPRHGRGHEFETRHPLHSGCVHALRGRVTRCGRSGMCAALARPRAARHRRPTGRSRVGTAEVGSTPRRRRSGVPPSPGGTAGGRPDEIRARARRCPRANESAVERECSQARGSVPAGVPLPGCGPSWRHMPHRAKPDDGDRRDAREGSGSGQAREASDVAQPRAAGRTPKRAHSPRSPPPG